MNENQKIWKIELNSEWINELLNSLNQGPITDDKGRRRFIEKTILKINSFKFEIYALEHPPPHFHVKYQGESNSFSIKDATPLEGDGLKKYFKNIKRWHSQYKQNIIECWNDMRPENCPVGEYHEYSKKE